MIQDNEFSPNVKMLRAEGIRIIQGRIPREIRKELMTAVKAGYLGRLPKDHLMSEIFFHPDQKKRAEELQISEAMEAKIRIAKILC